MNKSKIIFAIVLVLILGIIGVLVGLNWNSLTSSSKLYTYEELQKSYNDGLAKNKDLLDKKDDQLELYKLRLNDANLAEREKLLIIASLQDTIATLQSQLNQLQESIVENENWYNRYQTILNQLEVYQEALSHYIDETECAITYKVGNDIIDLQIVAKGSVITTVPTVTFDTDCYDVFNFWTLNDVETNPIGMAITENTEFVADITHKFKATYAVNGETLSYEILNAGSTVTFPTVTGKENWFFKGYFVGSNEIDLETFTIAENVIINAVYTQTANATFMANGSLYTSLVITKNSSITAPANPTQVIDGKESRFNGWKVDGEFVDLNTFVMTTDTVFVADFSKKITITSKVYYTDVHLSGTYQYVSGYANSTLTVDMYAGDVYEQSLGSTSTQFFNMQCFYLNGELRGYITGTNGADYLICGVALDGDFETTYTNATIPQKGEQLTFGEDAIFYEDTNVVILTYRQYANNSGTIQTPIWF